MKHPLKRFFKKIKLEIFFLFLALLLFLGGTALFWVSSFKIPDLNSIQTRTVAQSTKIYDRTGQVLLYDIFQGAKRITVPFTQISRNLKNATVAIEDAEFYNHGGIKITSIFRAVFANILSGSYGQGGSTITQQVVKNSLLTTEKTITRKLKEWVLSLKLEKVLTKDQILELYLNENPYGGSLYGVEEACQSFFGKKSQDVTLAEAAYIAALPQAPTYYSPYGNNRQKLEERKNLVLSKMLENKFITSAEYTQAKTELVLFKPQEKTGIKAPHFVTYIKQYLEDKYGQKALLERGFKVTTTLDYELQTKAEALVKKYALQNQKTFNAENAALVVEDPKTGQILTMVGSRDYFDKEIDGNFNVTLAHRQPGSTFKPFVYATAFNKGYTPDTVLFDVATEFQSSCDPKGIPLDATTKPEDCYMPENYDGLYRGPISLRQALAQSINIPAIKTLYLAGIKDSLRTAKDLGINSLGDANTYGLTLVLGGGEVSLLDMVSAYGVFANSGTKNKPVGILKVEDRAGTILEEYTKNSEAVLAENTALEISDILSDDKARQPAYGPHSMLYFDNRAVAVKTGTTNDYKDAWIIGYTPSLVVGAWAGNNNNRPMEKKVAGQIVAPLWNAFMQEALKTVPVENFKKPAEIRSDLKPILRGFWQGNETYFIDTMSGRLATTLTPLETKKEIAKTNIHSLLFWVNKNDPLGAVPDFPGQDSQFSNWEYAVQEWLKLNPQNLNYPPTLTDNIHTPEMAPRINILYPTPETLLSRQNKVFVQNRISSIFTISKIELYINGDYINSTSLPPYSLTFNPSELDNLGVVNDLKVVVYDTVFNRTEASITFRLAD